MTIKVRYLAELWPFDERESFVILFIGLLFAFGVVVGRLSA